MRDSTTTGIDDRSLISVKLQRASRASVEYRGVVGIRHLVTVPLNFPRSLDARRIRGQQSLDQIFKDEYRSSISPVLAPSHIPRACVDYLLHYPAHADRYSHLRGGLPPPPAAGCVAAVTSHGGAIGAGHD